MKDKDKNNSPLKKTSPEVQEGQVELFYSASYSSPYPPPEILNHYDEDFKKSILSMAEKEQKARHAYFTQEQKNKFSYMKNERTQGAVIQIIAIIGGILLGGIAICGAVYLLYKGKTLSGLAVVIAQLSVLIAAMIHGNKVSKKYFTEGKSKEKP